MLRPYQQAAHDAVIDWVRQSIEPCLIEAATGAGKSHIIAAVAKTIHEMSGKKVLCLCPSGELVEQNFEKYTKTGEKASLFSASVGKMSLAHNVVFGTPLTVKNKLSRFRGEFGMIIIDEADGITPSITNIIDSIRSHNPNVRVVGLTGTPYRLGSGFIYRIDEKGELVPEYKTKDPYFAKLLFRITARQLIDDGYLTPPEIGAIGAGKYATESLQPNSMGKFDSKAVDQAYHGHGRKTAAIIGDIVAQSRGKQGVLIFCATVKHAQEAFASLPPEFSAIVTDKTTKQDRAKIVRLFKARKIKYLVNVGVFLRGFDAPHVDVIALLRLTESAALLQQAIGRGTRLHESNQLPIIDAPEARKAVISNGDKPSFLLLDYAGNIERHFPDGDVFDPEIRASFSSGESVPVECQCPACGVTNVFKARKNPDGYEIDVNGYFVDLAGNRIKSDYGDIPGHSGRRCQGLSLAAGGILEQCGYRWTGKECGACGAENDIAARYCVECKAEIVNPNDKLRMEFKALKRDPCNLQTDELIDWSVGKSIARSGRQTWKIDWKTPYRSFTTWTIAEPQNDYQFRELRRLTDGTQGFKVMPSSVTYQKDKDSGFFRITAFNREPDMCDL